jgi:hypothetical protein
MMTIMMLRFRILVLFIQMRLSKWSVRGLSVAGAIPPGA